jgi:pimeloyl-ACP methyl ester carboxylesterase
MQTIPGAGHMVMLEAPGPLAEAIKDFVTSSGHPGS